jgi:hypothetical protein
MRHIKVRSVEETKNPALEQLMQAAWEDAPDLIAKLHHDVTRNKQQS